MKCPGQDTQFWGYGAIFEATCPDCGGTVEFFKDDTMRTCHGCSKRLANPKLDFGCASYCQFADACIGSLPPELLAEKRNLIKDRVAVEVKKKCGRDFTRIGRAAALARCAEKIAEETSGADLAVLLCAATLSVLTVDEAREILITISAPEGLAAEVLDLLEEASTESTDINRAILSDARSIVRHESAGDTGLGEDEFKSQVAPELSLPASVTVARVILAAS